MAILRPMPTFQSARRVGFQPQGARSPAGTRRASDLRWIAKPPKIMFRGTPGPAFCTAANSSFVSATVVMHCSIILLRSQRVGTRNQGHQATVIHCSRMVVSLPSLRSDVDNSRGAGPRLFALGEAQMRARRTTWRIAASCWERSNGSERRVNSMGKRSCTIGCDQTARPCAFCSMNTAFHWSRVLVTYIVEKSNPLASPA